MSLITKLFSPKSLQEKRPIPLAEYFLDLIGRPDFPLKLANDAFLALKKTAKTETQLYEYLLEDIIFTSIYSSFYEEIFHALRLHPHLIVNLVEKFLQDEKERENLIAQHTENHLNFVLRNGVCPGCSSCDHHQDVADLLEHWNKGDIDFLIRTYLGMQTIQFAMEHIIHDIIPINTKVCEMLTAENIQNFRKYVFDYAGENSKQAIFSTLKSINS